MISRNGVQINPIKGMENPDFSKKSGMCDLKIEGE